jgi:hypothetical protein
MRLFVGRLGILALAALGVARPARAQLLANPVYVSPKAPTGLTLAADFGTTAQTKYDNVTQTLKPMNLGVRATLGLPIITVGVGAGLYDPKGGASKVTQLSADAALKIFSPPLVPLGIALQAGIGYAKRDSTFKEYTVPIALGIAVKPPTPGLSVEGWAAPRVQLGLVSASGNSTVQAGYGVSAGVNLGLPTGLGVHAAVDWSKLAQKTTTALSLPQAQTLVLGVGVHYTFTIPGLPMVPII